MTRGAKKILCMTLVVLLVIACASPAFANNEIRDITPATVKQRFGAWVASALMAGQILVESVVIPATNMYEFLSDPFDVSYSYVDTLYQEWMDKNKIVIDSNHVQIDGTWYDNVWLSHDAADKFRTNALDFKTAFNIVNNSNGTFAEGVGLFGDVAMYSDDGIITSQKYNAPIKNIAIYNVGNPGTLNVYQSPVAQNRRGFEYLTSNGISLFNLPNFADINQTETVTIRYRYFNNENQVLLGFNNWGTREDVYKYRGDKTFIEQPFDFDWVSKVIDLDPLSSDEGISILVPHEQMTPFYNEHPDFNPQINPNINIDVDSPDFGNIWDMVDDIIDIITGVLRLLPDGSVKFEPEPDPQPEPQPPEPQPQPYPDPQPVPYPDPDPQPGTTIPDIDWTELFQTIKNIYDSISQGNVIKQVIGNINMDIRNLVDNIKWQIQQLRDQMGDIADKIIHGNKDWFSDIVDAIKAPLLPWITIIKSGVSIWHYVVEWISYISGPFVYFFNVTRNINEYVILPIYAFIAGTIVISIYRRFGR